MRDAPTILTIILNYRTPDLTLRACEAALREMAGLQGEVLIIDNGSGDGSPTRLRQAASERGWLADDRLRIIETGHNGGFGAGMNVGFRTGLSNGEAPDFYYLLNSDAWPDPGAVARLRDALLDNPDAGFAGSGLRGTDDAPHQTAFRFPSIASEFETAARTGIVSRWLRHSIVAIEMPAQQTPVDWTAGASLMIRREVIAATGGFDERFFLYYEETDLCRRARDLGWQTLYLPESRVVHVGSASTGMKTWARTPPYWFDSRLLYFRKTHGRAYAAAATGALIAGHLVWGLRRLLQNRPQVDPDHHLRDLVTHSFRALFRGAPAPSAATAVLTEDAK